MGAAGVVVRNVLDTASWGYYVPGHGGMSPGAPDAWQFPAANLATYRPGMVWRSQRIAHSYAWGIMPGLVTGIDTIAILNHNLPAGSALSIGRTVDSYELGGPVTWDHETIPTITGPGSLWVKLPAPVSARTLLIWISRFGPITSEQPPFGSVPPQIGEFYAGALEELPSHYQWGDEESDTYLGAGGTMEYGTPYRYHLAQHRTFTGQLQNAMLRTDAERVRSIIRRTKGSAHPFLFVPDVDGGDVVLGRLGADSYSAKSLLPDRVAALPFTVIEDPYGEDGA